MKAAAVVVAACCAAASTTMAFQAATTPLPIIRTMSTIMPMSAARRPASATAAATSSYLKLHYGALSPVDDDTDDDTDATDDNVLSSEGPKALGPKRTFLGLRRESGIMRRMLMEQQSQSLVSTVSSTSTALSSSATALMPDGGLSPCVIKVLGVGGGGSNAVRVTLLLFRLLYINSFKHEINRSSNNPHPFPFSTLLSLLSQIFVSTLFSFNVCNVYYR
jgi:cell division protein FtsZ